MWQTRKSWEKETRFMALFEIPFGLKQWVAVVSLANSVMPALQLAMLSSPKSVLAGYGKPAQTTVLPSSSLSMQAKDASFSTGKRTRIACLLTVPSKQEYSSKPLRLPEYCLAYKLAIVVVGGCLSIARWRWPACALDQPFDCPQAS